MHKMKKSNLVWIVLGLLLLILIIWGLIGSSKAAEIGITCDSGIGEDGSALCWKWHTNAIGDIGNELDELFRK